MKYIIHFHFYLLFFFLIVTLTYCLSRFSICSLPYHTICRLLAPWPEIEPQPPGNWRCRVLTTDSQGIPYLPHSYWTFPLVCFSLIWVGFVWTGGEVLEDLLLDVLSIISATKRDTSILFWKNPISFPYEFTRFSKTVLNSSSWLFENNFTIKTISLKKILAFLK